MPALRNWNWYAKNETRAYPLDDTAILSADDGSVLPHGLLIDLYMRFPGTLGKRAFLSSLTVSPRLVTLTFQGDAAGFQPLGFVSLTRPIEPYRQYPLTPHADGVGGWVVLGSAIEEVSQTVSYRFSQPSQSLLLARAAWHYRLQPSRGLLAAGTTDVLRGRVRLRGDRDLETRLETIEIASVSYQAIVIGLRNKSNDQRNLLEIYAGDCGQRPESRSCRNPQPIEFINDVGPDCCGDLYVEFRGCASLLEISNGNGVLVSCDFGLASACVTPQHLPDNDGRLPNEYPDLCEPETVAPLAESIEPALLSPMSISVSPMTAETLEVSMPAQGQGAGGRILESFLDDRNQLQLRTVRPHGMTVGQEIVLPETRVAGDLLRGTVLAVPDPYEMVLSSGAVAPVTGSSWLASQAAATGARIVEIIGRGGEALVTLDRPHTLLSGDRVLLADTGTIYTGEYSVLYVPSDRSFFIAARDGRAVTGLCVRISRAGQTHGQGWKSSSSRLLRHVLAPFREGALYAVTLQQLDDSKGGVAGIFLGDSSEGPCYAAALSFDRNLSSRMLGVYRLSAGQTTLLGYSLLSLRRDQRYRLAAEVVRQADKRELYATVLPLDDDVQGQARVTIGTEVLSSAGLYAAYCTTLFSDWHVRG